MKIASERARRQSQEYSEKRVEGVEPKIERERVSGIRTQREEEREREKVYLMVGRKRG